MFNFNSMAPWVPTFNQAVENELIAKKNEPPFITFQLATIGKTGFPRNRTLVYRGWLFGNKSSNVITFTTDRRSAKYQELEENDKFEAVFYFEKLKKQFRFRGSARIIDSKYSPVVDMSYVDNVRLGMGRYDEDDENDHEEKVLDNTIEIPQDGTTQKGKHNDYHDYHDINETKEIEPESDSDSELEFNASHSPSDTSITTSNNWPKQSPQKKPIALSLCSPSLTQCASMGDLSYTHLSEMQYYPPTNKDWTVEVQRQWDEMSKYMKKQFRKPAPLTPMSDENHKQIDKIRRGVDGKKDEDGFKNFAVIALFVEHADFIELDKDRRVFFEKDTYNMWGEQEVCP